MEITKLKKAIELKGEIDDLKEFLGCVDYDHKDNDDKLRWINIILHKRIIVKFSSLVEYVFFNKEHTVKVPQGILDDVCDIVSKRIDKLEKELESL